MIFKPDIMFRATVPALLTICHIAMLLPASRAAADDAAALELFETRIRPVLVKECYQCHSAQAAQQKKLKGGLLLDTREGARKGGESGPAVVPGKPDESLLVSALKHEDFEMPPKGKLPDAVIADFVKWVELGAPDPRAGTVAAAGRQIDIAAGRQFWSLKRFEPVAPPEVADRGWVRTPVDQFIRAKQEALGLKPNGPAPARVLIRRAYFDLIGLPPAPDEMEKWVARLTGGNGEAVSDLSAYAELIDQLLASEHYGERWARHWMDVARFAESHGYEQDYDRPTAYHYRDFLIEAFNADMPYDRFVRWQLAGDELSPGDPLAWMATGFLGAGAFPTQLTEAEFESARYDELDDMVATTGVAFLGLSVGCARCHDHKFDPVRSDDYYRLASTFTTTIRSEIELDLQPRENARRKAEYEARLAELTGEVAKYEREVLPGKLSEWLDHPNTKHAIGRFRLSVTRQADAPPTVGNAGPDAKVVDAILRLKQSGEREGADWQTALGWYKTTLDDWRQLDQSLSDLKKAGPGLQLTKVLVASEGLPHLPHHADDRGYPHFYPETYFLRRGDVNQKGDVAAPGFLPVLLREGEDGTRWQPATSVDASTKSSSRRSRLAAWMTDAEHGAGHLAARVMVNRLWQHHFGRGLVATPNDFGSSGERPTHPELLDWLAQDLVANGWQLKRLHKLVMTSGVYVQSADFDEARAKIDRENAYHWRRTPRRLEAEAVRDSMLAVSGLLDPAMYGPGTLDQNMRRRSVYFFIKRSQLIPMMMLFDWPEHLVSIGQRASTTIAPQALMFMNSPQGRQYAEAFAGRLSDVAEEQFVPAAYGLAFGRRPGTKELALAAQFLAKQSAAHASAGRKDASSVARADFCQALMSMNEFIYME